MDGWKGHSHWSSFPRIGMVIEEKTGEDEDECVFITQCPSVWCEKANMKRSDVPEGSPRPGDYP